MVMISGPRLLAMQGAGQAIPTPVAGQFLLDTGASGTVIDHDLVAALNLPVISQVGITTPSTTAGASEMRNQYDIGLFIPSGNSSDQGFHIAAMPVIATAMRHQGIDGLIGRDVLNRCTLTYIGSAAVFSLSY